MYWEAAIRFFPKESHVVSAFVLKAFLLLMDYLLESEQSFMDWRVGSAHACFPELKMRNPSTFLD